MKCPKCGSIKQLTPESRRTEEAVWRRRVCKACGHMWLTQEQISPEAKMPEETRKFLDTEMRSTPKHTKLEPGEDPLGYKNKRQKENFGKSGLKKLPW